MQFSLRQAAADIGPLTESEQALWLETAYAEGQRLAPSCDRALDSHGAALAAANIAVRARRSLGASTQPRALIEGRLPAAVAPLAEQRFEPRADRRAEASAEPRIEQLVEYTSSVGLSPRVDRHGGRIFGVKVLGLESRNGRSYRTEVVAAAAPLYEGVKVNLNHPKGRPQEARDYQDRLGCLRNVRATEAGLFGDLYFNPRHPLAEQLAWDAEHAPENVGLSHNVQARTRRQGEQVLIEAIERVNSVDLVADPATTRGLFEHASGDALPTAVPTTPTTPATPAMPTTNAANAELNDLRQRLSRLEALHEQRPSFTNYAPRPVSPTAPQSRGPEPPRDSIREPLDVARWARSIT